MAHPSKATTFIEEMCRKARTPEEIASAFELTFSTEHAQKEGVFYTPIEIVDRIIGESLSDCPNPDSVFDPACGAGLFLIRALRSLSAISPPSDVLHKIYGMDRDPDAVLVCRFVLQKTYEEISGGAAPNEIVELISKNIVVGNFLIDSNDPAVMTACKFEGTNFNSLFPDVMSQGGFSIIIGNPPYGLSRSGRIDPIENSLLKKIYAKSRDGKLNKYMMFMVRGFDLLKNGGALGFIVPNAWLGIAAGRKLRRHLIEEMAIRKIISFSTPVFQRAGVEPVIVCLRKSGAFEKVLVETDTHSFSLPTSEIKKDKEMRISLNWSRDSSEMLDKIFAHSIRLGSKDSPFQPLIALQAYAVGKGSPPQTPEVVRDHSFHFRAKIDSNTLPYLEGRDVERFAVNWSGSFLSYGKWLAEYQPIERFSKPRVLVREIVGRKPYVVKSAVVEEPMLYNRSVLHIIGKSQIAPEYFWALSTILNSRLASTILSLTGRKTQRKLFPKIVRDDLADFPIPNQFAKYVSDLSRLGHLVTDKLKSGAEATLIEEEIESVVSKAYGLGS